MKNPNIKTRVVHSTSKPAWNVVGTKLGGKYKIAIVPYVTSETMEVVDTARDEALEHANFIAYCFNQPNTIEQETKFLRHLIDVAWNHANGDESVPSTKWADKIITQARDTFVR